MEPIFKEDDDGSVSCALFPSNEEMLKNLKFGDRFHAIIMGQQVACTVVKEYGPSAYLDQIKLMDYKDAIMKAEAKGMSTEFLQEMRRYWYPTEAEKKEREMQSKMAEITLRDVKYSAFDL